MDAPNSSTVKNILITGYSGFYGRCLIPFLTEREIKCYGIDLNLAPDLDFVDQSNVNLLSPLPDNLFEGIEFDAVIHLATEIDFAVDNQLRLYENNCLMTRNILDFCKKRNIKNFIFTSSNSIFLGNSSMPIGDCEIPRPTDMYGKSKVAIEEMLADSEKPENFNIVRCPIIIDAGRVGMLSILFELIRQNSTIWILDNGSVRHQCIYAQDLNAAIYKMLFKSGRNTYNIGCDRVDSIKEIYSGLVKVARSQSKIRSIPKKITLFFLKSLYKLGVSPVGPYQFRMLSEDFIFDLKKIKAELDWAPTKSNSEVLQLAYQSYVDSQSAMDKVSSSANSKKINFGILKLLNLIKY